MIGSIERYLRCKSYSASFVTRAESFGTREILKSKQNKTLNNLGKEAKPKTADAITDDDIEKLFEASEL